MKAYKETKAEIKKIVIQFGISGVYPYINTLIDQGHNVTNLLNAIDYFKFSPQAAKYR